MSLGVYTTLYVNLDKCASWRLAVSPIEPEKKSPSVELVTAAIKEIKCNPLILHTRLSGGLEGRPSIWVITPDPVNIYGLREDGAPTKWALWEGLWSPVIAAEILQVLEDYLAGRLTDPYEDEECKEREKREREAEEEDP